MATKPRASLLAALLTLPVLLLLSVGGGLSPAVAVAGEAAEPYPARNVLLSAATLQLRGTYTIQQASNSRYVDAHESSAQDFRLVTRTRQKNDTQRWEITPVGRNEYRIQQRSNDRYVDAHTSSNQDFRLVTRERQNNDTQVWIITPAGRDVYTIQQKSNRRYVDAHEHSGEDFRLVTRTWQNNDTQRWVIRRN